MSNQQIHLVAKKRHLGEKMALVFSNEVPHTTQYSLTCRKILRHGTDGFTSSTKEVVLRICIALKNSSSSARFESANYGSNGKHDNH
jgi:hypothetical protein